MRLAVCILLGIAGAFLIFAIGQQMPVEIRGFGVAALMVVAVLGIANIAKNFPRR